MPPGIDSTVHSQFIQYLSSFDYKHHGLLCKRCLKKCVKFKNLFQLTLQGSRLHIPPKSNFSIYLFVAAFIEVGGDTQNHRLKSFKKCLKSYPFCRSNSRRCRACYLQNSCCIFLTSPACPPKSHQPSNKIFQLFGLFSGVCVCLIQRLCEAMQSSTKEICLHSICHIATKIKITVAKIKTSGVTFLSVLTPVIIWKDSF